MKVSELITALQQYDPEMEVKYYNSDDGCSFDPVLTPSAAYMAPITWDTIRKTHLEIYFIYPKANK